MAMEFWINGNVPSLKNGKIWTGSHLVSAPSIRKWQKISKEDWLIHKSRFIQNLCGLSRPYFIHLTFARSRDNTWDFTAPTETVMDEMVHQGWLNDDNIYEVVPCFGRPYIDRKNPGVLIKILKEPPKYSFL